MQKPYCFSYKFFLFIFVLLQEKKFKHSITNIFWFIFVANNKNNRSAFEVVFDYILYKFILIPFNLQYMLEQGIRIIPSFLSMMMIKNKWILKAVPPISVFYIPDFLSFHWDQMK